MPHFRVLRAALPALLSIFLLTSCREDAVIGTSLVGIDDSINTISVDDMVGVTARSVYDDTVITAFLDLGIRLIGTDQGIGMVSSDPYAGRITAGLYFSVVPPSGGFDIDTTGLTIDSVVLLLPYSGFAWGDTSNSAPGQRWSVYKVEDDLYPDTPYLSNRRLRFSDRIGSALVYKNDYARPRMIEGTSRPAHLRVRLDASFISNLLRNNSTKLGSAAAMREFFKGFYVAPDDGQNAAALAYFRFSASTGLYERPAMLLYYQTPARDSSLAVFPFSVDSSAAFTRVRRDYGGSPAYNVLFSADETGRPKDVLLLQNEPGAAIDVRLYGLKSLPRGVYPKAQVILTKIDTAQSDKFFEPARVFPIGVDDAGGTYTLLDRQPEGSSAPLDFIDGRRRTVTVGGVTVTQYVVNVPRAFQRAITDGKDTLHLRLNGVSGFPGAYRLIAGGADHGSWKIRASVAYSRQ